MARYVVFDVETPNHLNNRMSAIGISVVEDGRLVREFFSLVNPETFFEEFNVQLTGISTEKVADAPVFPALWQEIEPIMSQGTLVAHNALFDLNVLKKCLEHYHIRWHPSVSYLCTVQIGRSLLPGMRHHLDALCDYYGIRLNHHQADSDSHACAEILLKYMSEASDLSPWLSRFRFRSEWDGQEPEYLDGDEETSRLQEGAEATAEDPEKMQLALSVLRRTFGYECFRPGQRELVSALLNGQDALGVMPTGAGKSLCYQVPALVLPGVTLVVSPLISLMKDQVGALIQAGVPAAYLNSSLTPRQMDLALGFLRTGKYKIVYVAPERLLTEAFLEVCQSLELSLLAVDEAHCISHWGQDFRPDYLRIAEFIGRLPSRPPVGAFTATATPRVSRDIIEKLALRNAVRVQTGFDRPNLFFSVQQVRSRPDAIQTYVQEHPDRSGIIYCGTRKTVETLCKRLQDAGIPATRYHAGLTAEERQRNQEDFSCDRARIIVATNAFGMGIDKSNVSFVIHYNMPKSLEDYYQEAGRAGRDGEKADCILYFSAQDILLNQQLIDQPGENDMLSEDERELIRQGRILRLRKMAGYAEGTGCLRAIILRYFGEKDVPDQCGNCSNCLGQYEREDITVEAQKILSCVYRTGQRYGMTVIADVLKGIEDPRYERLGLMAQSTFGIMKDRSIREIKAIIAALVQQGYLCFSDGDYPVLWFTEKSREGLAGKTSIEMRKQAGRKKDRQKQSRIPAAAQEEDPALFERLRRMRLEMAREEHIPPYIIFHDKALREMSVRKPRSIRELFAVSGVGERKAEKYGEAILQVIGNYLEGRPEEEDLVKKEDSERETDSMNGTRDGREQKENAPEKAGSALLREGEPEAQWLSMDHDMGGI